MWGWVAKPLSPAGVNVSRDTEMYINFNNVISTISRDITFFKLVSIIILIM
jgi:hypothetical protein